MKKLPLIIILLFLAACSPAEAPVMDVTDTAVPTSTSTPEPTATAVPTETPTLPPSPTPFMPPIFTPFPTAEQGALVMDGFFEDWAALDPIYVDPTGDAGPSGVDFTGVYASHTDTHLLLKVNLGKVVNLQSEEALQLEIQIDDLEIRYNFGKRIGRINGESVRQDEVGLITLPTVTSDMFEISIPHAGDFSKPVKFLFTDPAEGGDLASENGEPLVYDWKNNISTADQDTLERPEGTIRVVSWNVLRDNIFDRNLGPNFERVLKALQPDILLIQEIYIYSEKTALNRVNEWLGGEWFAKKQGDLITISRFPFIEDWREGNHNLRVRIFPTMIDVNGSPLVIFNAHLSCCDRDQDRQNEVDSFIGFLREVGLPAGMPFLLAGDLNLVGDAQQLTTLLTGNIMDEDKWGVDFVPDWDGTTLKDLVPGHTHSNFATTWRDDKTSFAPGRLDFMIYSDSVLNARGFVLDTAELPLDILEAYGMQAEDTSASDHLPLIGDFEIVPTR